MRTKAKPGQTASTVDEWLAAHPERRAKHRPISPSPVVLSQSEKDRAAVLEALGHGNDGKCPAGGSEAAQERLLLVANYVQPVTMDEYRAFARCGWTWCQDKGCIAPSQWAGAHAALGILRDKNIDPNDIEVVKLAGEYAASADWRKMWPMFRPLAVFVAGNPTARDSVEPQLLRQAEIAKRSGGPKKDAPMYDFVAGVKSKGWSPAVAAAILFLFRLTKKSERLGKLNGRVAVFGSRSK